MSAKDEHSRNMISVYLDQVDYWHDRFEISRDIKHLDNAERYADVVRMYLPEYFQDLSIIGLCNLYQRSLSLSNTDSSGD